MQILAIDTSSVVASCALLRDNILLAEVYTHTGLTHSETALVLVDQLLTLCNTSLAEVDYFAVSVGPGSFTGLRIGLSIIKGFGVGREHMRQVAAVSTLESLVQSLPIENSLLLPVMDARRSQVYTAAFCYQQGSYERQLADSLLTLDELADFLSDRSEFPIYLVGDGAEIAYEALSSKFAPALRITPPQLRYQHGGNIALVAQRLIETGQCISFAALQPDYIRASQAERERLEQQKAPKTEGD